jgi:predicted alpha/beta hydrolase family esterase
MRPILIIPGYGNSGPGHWQSLWEANLRYAKRVQMPNWDFPHCASWVEALDTAIRAISQELPPVLVAHSLGCLAVAHWARRYQRPVHNALLVAPVDVERQDVLEAMKDFAPIPMFALPFPSHVVASSDDPYTSIERSREIADAWDSHFTNVGPRGHINTASGFGEWPRGDAFLQDMI